MDHGAFCALYSSYLFLVAAESIHVCEFSTTGFAMDVALACLHLPLAMGIIGHVVRVMYTALCAEFRGIIDTGHHLCTADRERLVLG